MSTYSAIWDGSTPRSTSRSFSAIITSPMIFLVIFSWYLVLFVCIFLRRQIAILLPCSSFFVPVRSRPGDLAAAPSLLYRKDQNTSPKMTSLIASYPLTRESTKLRNWQTRFMEHFLGIHERIHSEPVHVCNTSKLAVLIRWTHCSALFNILAFSLEFEDNPRNSESNFPRTLLLTNPTKARIGRAIWMEKSGWPATPAFTRI